MWAHLPQYPRYLWFTITFSDVVTWSGCAELGFYNEQLQSLRLKRTQVGALLMLLAHQWFPGILSPTLLHSRTRLLKVPPLCFHIWLEKGGCWVTLLDFKYFFQGVLSTSSYISCAKGGQMTIPNSRNDQILLLALKEKGQEHLRNRTSRTNIVRIMG